MRGDRRSEFLGQEAGHGGFLLGKKRILSECSCPHSLMGVSAGGGNPLQSRGPRGFFSF